MFLIRRIPVTVKFILRNTPIVGYPLSCLHHYQATGYPGDTWYAFAYTFIYARLFRDTRHNIRGRMCKGRYFHTDTLTPGVEYHDTVFPIGTHIPKGDYSLVQIYLIFNNNKIIQ